MVLPRPAMKARGLAGHCHPHLVVGLFTSSTSMFVGRGGSTRRLLALCRLSEGSKSSICKEKIGEGGLGRTDSIQTVHVLGRGRINHIVVIRS